MVGSNLVESCPHAANPDWKKRDDLPAVAPSAFEVLQDLAWRRGRALNTILILLWRREGFGHSSCSRNPQVANSTLAEVPQLAAAPLRIA